MENVTLRMLTTKKFAKYNVPLIYIFKGSEYYYASRGESIFYPATEGYELNSPLVCSYFAPSKLLNKSDVKLAP